MMETSFLDDSVGKTSDILFEMFCESCRKDKIYSKANGFCKDCVEYFCEKCKRFHDRFLPNHTYQDELTMPQDFCLETCETHSTEIIKFYCENCEQFACYICKTLQHKECQILKHIPSIVQNIERDMEFKSFKHKLEHNESRLKEITEKLLQEKQSDIIQYFENAKSVLEAQKEDIRNIFDNFKNKIERKLEEISKTDENSIANLLQEYKILCSKCKSLRRSVDIMSTERQRSKLFITMKNSMDDMALFEKSISTIRARCKIKKYTYESNKFFRHTFECSDCIGSVVVEKEEENEEEEEDVEEKEDKLGSRREMSSEILDISKTDLYKRAFQRIGVTGMAAELNNELNGLKTDTVNIAVIGCSAVGKSTFINSMCEFEPGDSSAAQTGLAETTSKVTPYHLQRNDNVILWDFPGFDANQIQSEKYFALIDFDKMDAFIIILSLRVTEKDRHLIHYVEHHGKLYYLLRSKFDCDLENTRMQNCSNDFKEKMLKTKLKSSFKNALKEFKYEHDIYIIDSFNLKSHDYEEFEKVLISDAAHLSEEKSMSLTFALPIITEFAKSRKRIVLEKRLAEKALEAATCLPSSKDIAISLKEEDDLYKRQFFCLSDIKLISNKDLSHITKALSDIKETLIHKQVDIAKHDLFKEQGKMTESIFPFFDIVETYEVCWVWLKNSLESTMKIGSTT